jgi:hypothetical protein
MKEKDIYIEYKTHEIILYAEKEDESYAPVVCGSYAAKHHLDEFFRLKENLDISLKQKLREGKISPIYYFMLMQDMGPGDLAKRVGISKRKLGKHFKPDVFAKLSDAMLQKYAVVFGVSVDQIKEINIQTK